MLDPMPTFPGSMDFIPMLDKTSDLVERGLAQAAARWDASFMARHSGFQGGAIIVPEDYAGFVLDSMT